MNRNLNAMEFGWPVFLKNENKSKKCATITPKGKWINFPCSIIAFNGVRLWHAA